MTRKVFWEDPYLSEFSTRVARVEGAEIALEATIFFAESGGQESDRGSVGGRPVRAARWVGRDIVYALDLDHGLKPGDPVVVAIDWERRYRLMRLHFAAEIVLELVYRELPGIEKIGAHIAEDKARVDFAWHESISSRFPELRRRAEAIVAGDRPIVSAYSDRADERRYWQIAEFAAVPCGGTHLKRTGEIGAFDLRRRNIGKGKERIEIALAGGAG
jgi:Ser-tRNA(Ala) deacylase AlaX